MTRLTLLLTTILIWPLIMGCSTSAALSTKATAQGNPPLLLFQKTPCLGTCPAYNATLYADGTVSFVEFRNALAQDTLQLQLPKAELEQLKTKIKSLNYHALQNSYTSQWSDNSATYLTFYEAGKKAKRVKHEEGGPQQLVQFQDWLHALIWQRAEEKKLPTY